jgi:tetratricopeptide (TPR) repeat protein
MTDEVRKEESSQEVPQTDLIAGTSKLLSRSLLAAVAILAVAAALVWHRVLSNGFVWHDGPYVAANLALRDADVMSYFSDAATSVAPGWPGVEPVFRPLRSLSYRLDFIMGGPLNAKLGHAHNVALHLLNGLLLLGIARYMGFGLLGAAFVSILFLVHPVQSEAVCWLYGRDVLLATALVLAGSLYAVWRASRGWRLVDAAVLSAVYMAACLANPQAIVFPAIAFFFVLGSKGRGERGSPDAPAGVNTGTGRRRAMAWATVAMLAAVAVLYVSWSFAAIGAGGRTPSVAAGGWRTELLAVDRAVALFLFPTTLTPDYSDMGTGHGGEGVVLALGALLLALALFVVVWFRKSEPRLSAAMAVCWLGVVGAWQVEGVFFSERILYMPMAGVAFVGGVLLQRVAAFRLQTAGVVAAIVLLLAGGRTMMRVRDWANDGALLLPAFEYTPDSKPVMRQLMRYYFAARDYEKASVVADGLLSVTPEGPGFGTLRAEPLRVKALSLAATGSEDAGHSLLAEAVAADPYYGRAAHDMGLREMRLGRNAQAIEFFQKAAKLMPFDPSVHEHLGVVLETDERLSEAEAALRRAAEYEWIAPSAAGRLAAMLIRQKRMGEAEQVCRRSLRRFPGNKELLRLLSI